MASYASAMRIIAGEFRSRRLYTPPDDSITRPIPDRVKESVFGLLRGHCEGAAVFDGFAGTGAIGLEALSRGASRCVFVEQHKAIAGLLQRNVELLGVQDRAEVVVGDCLGAGALARAPRPLTIAFLDPPYPLIQEALGFRRVMAQLSSLVGLLAPDGIAVLRTPWPMRLRVPNESPAAERPQPQRKGKKGKKLDRREWKKALEADGSNGSHRSHETYPTHQTHTPTDTDTDDAPDDLPAPQPAQPPAWHEAELTLPNARGPETHIYHNTAVHLYMRGTYPSGQ